MSNQQLLPDHKLLERGLFFVERALELLQGETTHYELQLATILLPIGIELIVKKCLLEEHWSLLFANPKDAKLVDWQAGTLKTAGYEDCLDRLERVTNKKFDRKRWEGIRAKRNKLEHFGEVESVQSMKASSADALDGLFDFIRDFIGNDKLNAEERAKLTEIRKMSASFHHFVEKKLKDLRARLDGPNELFLVCPSCRITAGLVKGGLSCLFCETFVAPMLAATILARSADTIEDCPWCSAPQSFIRGPMGLCCLDCGKFEEIRLQRCPDCKTPFLNSEQGECYFCKSMKEKGYMDYTAFQTRRHKNPTEVENTREDMGADDKASENTNKISDNSR